MKVSEELKYELDDQHVSLKNSLETLDHYTEMVINKKQEIEIQEDKIAQLESAITALETIGL
jgi:biopolymer transport protein ExbD